MGEKLMKKLINLLSRVLSKKDAMLTGRHDGNIRVTFGGGSYTDGKTVTVGIQEFFLESDPKHEETKAKTGLNLDFNEAWMSGKGLGIHEIGHKLYSSFSQFKKYQDWFILEFENVRAKLSPSAQRVFPQVARKISANLNNALEDGRMEHRVVNTYPGSAKYLKFNNLMFWKIQDKPNDSELVNLLMCLCYYATSGIYPQYYDNLPQELKDNVEAVEDDIEEFLNIAGPMVATKKLEKITLKLKPYLEKLLLSEVEDAALMQELMDALSDVVDFQNANPMERPSENLGGEGTITIRMKKPSKGKSGKSTSSNSDSEDDSEDSSDSGEEGEDKDGEDGKSGKSGDDGEDSEDGSGEGEGDEDGKGDKDGKNGSKEGKDYSKDSFASHREAPGHAERGGKEGGKTSSKNADNNGAGTGGKNKAPTAADEAPINSVNEEVKAAIDEAINELRTSSEKEVQAEIKKEEREEKSSTELSSADVEAIRDGYDDSNVEGYAAVDVNVSMSAPDDIRTRGRMLRKQLETFFKEQETFDLYDQHSGRLNKKSLRRVAVNDFRIFEKKGTPYNVDSCVSIVWDGSGSMCGSKQKQSTIACAVIEEALKPLMAMQIINFTTESYVVKHFMVKKFDDRDPNRNYAYSYGSSRSFNGGNKDGYSIKIAARELEKRPEQNKILIVLSDGLPSDYRSHSAAINDVKVAVKDARKKGMKVIAIFFGNDEFRRDTLEEYQEMYEKNIISCAPENISKELVKQIRLLFMQK